MDAGNPRCLVLWIEYDGAHFHGWQVQPGQRTVQGEIEAALEKMCGEPARIIGSGRTDAGVHAWGQVAHFHTTSRVEPWKVRIGLNGMMGRDVSVFDCREAPGGFHAQFDAIGKTYRYRILNRPSPSAIRRSHTWHIRKPLDLEAMRQAAKILEGEHDFASFCREKGKPEDTARRLERLSVERAGDEVVIEARAGGFLRHMVRNLAGVLMEVGRGEREADSMRETLAGRSRRLAGVTAPPQGLALVRVEYGGKLPPEAAPGPEETVA